MTKTQDDIAILVSNKIDFKLKLVRRKEDDMTVLTTYAPNTGALHFIKQIFLDVNPARQQWEISVSHCHQSNNNSIQTKKKK